MENEKYYDGTPLSTILTDLAEAINNMKDSYRINDYDGVDHWVNYVKSLLVVIKDGEPDLYDEYLARMKNAYKEVKEEK